MSVTTGSFVEELLTEVPEAAGVVSEHMSDYDGDLLLHLLMADLLRFTVEAFRSGQADLSRRALGFVDRTLREGDEAVENAVAVSFVENVGSGEGETPGFLATWPPALLAEKARQDAWYEGNRSF